ncbi:MAG TPA: cytochrome bc complex cytochrome b subunit [Terriglobales bacterium]|nr:cytochrome bc complex cytochrome b subunit [Terriglobales bacterium]
MSPAAAVRAWVDERFGWEYLTKPLRKKTVPIHRLSYWYFLGGITLFLFGVQVITGMLLLLYYRPSANEAFESVQYIMTRVQFGWLIRSIHSWSANLMVFTAFAHMFSVLFLKSYRKPRELTWVSGMVLLVLTLGFGFSGYLLPWNTLSFFATKVGTEITGQVPLIGPKLMVFLRGGEDVTGATLTRFFGFHVALLPGITTLVLMMHLLLVQVFGISVPSQVEEAWQRENALRKGARNALRERPFLPNFLLRELMAWYIALGALGALAALYPWQLGVKADPFAPAPAGIKPEWYFLFMFQTLKLIPAKVWKFDGEVLGVLAFGAAGLIWLLLPFIDEKRFGRGGRLVMGIGIFALAYIVSMTAYGFIAK